MPRIPDLLVGHEKEQALLLGDIAKNNVSHAYLFSGPEHLGKLTIAQWFGMCLLCEGKSPDQYKIVKEQVERFIHPDFLCLDELWIDKINDDWTKLALSSNTPQQHRSKGTTAKSDVISIDDIHAIANRLQETSESQYFVCIIRGVERMHAEASNALLKILEEPPPRVVFILTTDNQKLLLPTIISRVRLLRFHPVPRAALEPLIAKEDEEDAAFALHIAQGAPGMLVRLLRDPELLRTHRQIHAQARQFWQAKTPRDRLAWIMANIEKSATPETMLLHLALTLQEHSDPVFRALAARAYADLLQRLETNAHKGLLFQRFALAIGKPE